MPPVTWTDWPARRSPGRAIFAAATVALAVAGIGATQPALAAIGGALLLGATGEVLLPTRYTLDARGVTTASPLGRRRRPWSQLDRWRPTPEGFAVIGAAPAGGAAAILRRRRSLLLRGAADPAAVAAWLSERLGPSAGAAAP